MGDETLAIEQATDDYIQAYEAVTDTGDGDGGSQGTVDADVPCGDAPDDIRDASIDTGTVDGVQNSIVGDLWDSAGDLVHEAYEGVRYAVGLPTDNADGSRTVKNGDGTTTTTYPDGHRDVHNADGTWTTTYPDGSKENTHPNGIWTKTLPDGTTVESHPDGTTTTTAADGSTTATHPNGTWTKTLPDGTTVDWQPGETTTAHPDGTVEIKGVNRF